MQACVVAATAIVLICGDKLQMKLRSVKVHST